MNLQLIQKDDFIGVGAYIDRKITPVNPVYLTHETRFKLDKSKEFEISVETQNVKTTICIKVKELNKIN